jgi:hypothetical protein
MAADRDDPSNGSRRNGKPSKPAVAQPSNGAEPEPEEFGQFEALTRKLLRVPKAEVDEKRRELDEQRRRTT